MQCKSGIIVIIQTVVLLSCLSATQAANVNINGATEYQAIEALGGDEGWIYPPDEAMRSKIFDELGVSQLRFRMLPNVEHGGNETNGNEVVENDNTDPFVINWGNVRTFFFDAAAPLLKAAQSRGVKLITTNHSVPVWMTTNVYEEETPGKGILRPGYEQELIEYIMIWIKGMELYHGVHFDYATIHNEPEVTWTNGSWLYYPSDRLADMTKRLGTRFQAEGVATKIFASEPTSLNSMRPGSYVDRILQDPVAKNYIDRLATHCYTQDFWNPDASIPAWQTAASLAATHGKKLWLTEYCNDGSSTGTWTEALPLAQHLHTALVYGGVSAWHVYELYRDPSQKALALISATGPTPKFYTIKQYFRWIRPGAVRVDAASSDSNVLVTAFKHEGQGTFTVVVINRDAAAAKTINCSLSNLPGSVAGLSMYRTSSTENCVDAGQVAVSAGSFSGVLPAYSITTFTGAMGTQKGALQFTSADWSSFENGAYGTNPLIIAVTRTGGSSGAVSVNFTTSNGTATAGSDYTAVSGTLNWADGDVTNKTFAVSILNDAICEGNETINLTLSSPTGGATPGTPSEAVLTIVERAGVLQYSAANFSVNENSGTATVSVKRSDGSAGAVSVDYRTIDRTATAGSDYTAVSGTLSWADGDTANKTFTVPVLDDAVYEGEETVTLAISNPTGGARLGSVYPGPMITMVDNDPAPPAGALLFGAPVYYDGRYRVMESGGSFQPNLSPVTIAVQRVGGSVGAVSVNYATGNGTATAGSDYTAVSGTLSWADGDTVSKTFTVSTLDDAVYEGDETVNLTLSNPTGGAALVPDRSADVLIIMENDTTHIVVSSQFSADKEDIAPFLTAYPSPFNPVVNFAFSAGRQGLLPSSAVKLRIYDLRGVLIKELSPKSSGQGVCRLTWDGRDCNGRPLSSQIFVVRLTAGRQVVTGKVIMMK